MASTPPYPNDSLRWVAAEIRYPPLDELADSVPAGLRDRLREHFPIREDQTQLSVTVGAAGPTAQQVQQHRFVRRDRLMSLGASRDALVLEATEYDGWTAFSNRLFTAIRALEEHSAPDGITRIGLRYIDEVRIPDAPPKFEAWRGWIDDRLVAPFTLDDEAELANGTVVLQYGQPPGYVTVFRAAPFGAGRTVQEGGNLRMPFATPDGPYFLLDTDSSWADPDGRVPEFSTDLIADVLENLHATSKRLFEASITDRLREEVLGRQRGEVWRT